MTSMAWQGGGIRQRRLLRCRTVAEMYISCSTTCTSRAAPHVHVGMYDMYMSCMEGRRVSVGGPYTSQHFHPLLAQI